MSHFSKPRHNKPNKFETLADAIGKPLLVPYKDSEKSKRTTSTI